MMRAVELARWFVQRVGVANCAYACVAILICVHYYTAT